MALYKMDENGEAVQTERHQWEEWCRNHNDMTKLILARHAIVEHKKLGAGVVDAMKGDPRGFKVLAIVVTRLLTSHDDTTTGPWETREVGTKDPAIEHSWDRAQAWVAHKDLVNTLLSLHGGRIPLK